MSISYIPIPELHTPRLILRKVTLEDIPHYFSRLGSSEAVTEHMLWSPHKDITESEASIRKALMRYETGKCYRWGIALKEDNSLMGILELLGFDEETAVCSFAYMLSRDHWGKGYGTEALKAAFHFAFTELKVAAIQADHFAENPASGAVMRKAGMTYLGTIPEKYEKNGVLHDAPQYRITREEWIRQCLQVRAAEISDARALGRILSRSFRTAFAPFLSPETVEACGQVENCIALMENLLREGNMRFLLGLLDGVPMGELIWGDGPTPDQAEIQAIHSLPESWGTGLGAAMLHKALEDMAESGRKSVILWAFRDNTRARRFYEKQGFTFTGEERTGEFDGAVEVRYIRNL